MTCWRWRARREAEVEPPALFEALVELAESVGLRVQRVGRHPAFDGLSPSSSAVVRVRGEVRVLLTDSDPLEARIALLARALREHAGSALEDRFLAPALRAVLEDDASQDRPDAGGD